MLKLNYTKLIKDYIIMVEFYTMCLILAVLCAFSVLNTYMNGLNFANLSFWSTLQTIYGLSIAAATFYVVYKGWTGIAAPPMPAQQSVFTAPIRPPMPAQQSGLSAPIRPPKYVPA